jgi:putative transposase
MNTYKRHRFPPDIISYAVWLCYRFNLSHRDIEDLLAERGIIVSYEGIKFGTLYSKRLKRKHRGYGDTFYIDEVFVKINRKQHYLWRAVDQDGEVVGVYLQVKRDGATAKRFFRRLLRSHEPTRVRERGMRRFKSMGQAQRFVATHAAVSNLFNLGRHLVRAEHYRNLRVSAFREWSRAVA